MPLKIPAVDPAFRREGKLMLLPVGVFNPEPREETKLWFTGGSMSNVVRNEVDSRSLMILVLARKVSNRVFCCDLGNPFRSSTYLIILASRDFFLQRTHTFWKLEKDESPTNKV